MAVWREQSFGNEVILAAPKRAERHVSLDDLARARIFDGLAVAVAAGEALDPLDDVVADVHRIGISGKDVYAKGVGRPTGGLEGLVPPARAFDQGGADGFGRAAIDEVLDRSLGDTAVGTTWVLLEEAMADDELLVERGAERNGVVAEAGGKVSGAGVEAARGKAWTGKGDEGLVFVDGDGARVGADVGEKVGLGGVIGGEGEDGFDLGVLGEGAGAVGEDVRSGEVDVVAALLGGG